MIRIYLSLYSHLIKFLSFDERQTQPPKTNNHPSQANCFQSLHQFNAPIEPNPAGKKPQMSNNARVRLK